MLLNWFDNVRMCNNSGIQKETHSNYSNGEPQTLSL